jgi:hypothetical protein
MGNKGRHGAGAIGEVMLTEEVTYQNWQVPQRLKKLYWHDPRTLAIWIASIFLIFLPSYWLIEKFSLNIWILLTPYLLGTFLFLRRAHRQYGILEADVIRDLPSGWHLIYRYHWIERRFRPELVFETDFARLFSKPKRWYRFSHVRMSRNDQSLQRKTESNSNS